MLTCAHQQASMRHLSSTLPVLNGGHSTNCMGPSIWTQPLVMPVYLAVQFLVYYLLKYSRRDIWRIQADETLNDASDSETTVLERIKSNLTECGIFIISLRLLRLFGAIALTALSALASSRSRHQIHATEGFILLCREPQVSMRDASYFWLNVVHSVFYVSTKAL